ncbi:hypothetical protein [Streptomyces sannanensis]|uniref:hypothetical protein n=1 Tax=Streptomyces sannanensis TaxID=285536 RepID=UPI0031EF2FED
MFRPTRSDRVVDPRIEAAHTARTVIGLVATLWLIFSYPLRQSAGDIAEDKFTEVLSSVGVLLVVGPIALTVFVLAARPPVRAVYRGRLSSPLTAMGILFGSLLVLWLLMTEAMMMLPQTGLFQIVLIPAVLASILFGLPFVLTAAVLCVHHVFRTADVHEVLPPLISPVLVWAMFVFQLFDSAPVAAPVWVRGLFLVGPPLSVTLLSLWELRRLRTEYGLTVRSALWRDDRVPA